jgi:predicted nucleotide-binding protein
MPRRTATQKPEDRHLSFQVENGIERLRLRITELKDLKPEEITDYRSPAIVGLETSITDTLAAIFGQDSPKFHRYYGAADLEPAPNLQIVPDWIGARHGGGSRGVDIHELQQGIAQRRDRAVALLEQAVRSLAEDIAHAQPSMAERVQTIADTHAQPRDMPQKAASRKVFIVHGHAGEPREAVARFLDRIDLKPIILHEQANQGKTIIEKFEAHADVGFAIVLLTPDDFGGTCGGAQHARARQNVILELGYFIGRLTRGRVCALKVGDLELPSDILGVVWTPYDTGGGWKVGLAKELHAAGYEIDWNNVMS